ncbi:unnamed protein product, partial [Ixodes pacificus]
LPIDCIKSSPLDYMHLVYLGVVKRLLSLWMTGPPAVRLGVAVRDEISQINLSLKMHVPREFSRKPRSLAELDRWKATELRLFLLYTGPVVLKKTLPRDLYLNFLTLHCAISLFVNKALCQGQADYADTLPRHFVATFAELYDDLVTHNVHFLIQLSKDVKNQGPLDSFSAFPFENHMKFLKRQLRKPGTPLEQLRNRFFERQGMLSTEAHKVKQLELCNLHNSGHLPVECRPPQYQMARLPEFTLSTKTRDNCSSLQGHIVVVSNIAFTKSDSMP